MCVEKSHFSMLNMSKETAVQELYIDIITLFETVFRICELKGSCVWIWELSDFRSTKGTQIFAGRVWNSTQNVTIKAQLQNKSELPPDESYSSLNMFGNEFLSLLHIYAVLWSCLISWPKDYDIYWQSVGPNQAGNGDIWYVDRCTHVVFVLVRSLYFSRH